MHGKIKSKWFVNQLLDATQKIGLKKLNLRPVHHILLIMLGHFSDKNGYCYPSQKQLSHATGISYANISKYIKFLENKKYISTKTKYSRRYNMNRKHYTIHLDIILNIGIDEKGGVKIEKMTTNNECKENEQTVDTTGRSMDQTVDATGPTIEVTTQLKDTNYPIKAKLDIVQPRALDDKNLINLNRDTHFEDFWAVYPRKEKKSKARDIWIRERLDTIAEEVIADVRDRQVRHDRWEDRSFIPMPTTYLNQEGWKDEIIERRKLERKSGGQSQPGSIRSYAEQLARVATKINNPHIRAFQNNLAREVDEEL